MSKHVDVRYAQAVYGSFPFWDRGYAILAHSPGCRPEWLTALRGVCQRFGERAAGVDEAPALFSLELDGDASIRLIVGVAPQGRDDRGRPGALAFHALFLDPRDFRRGGADPFAFASVLRHDWTADDESLPDGVLTVEPVEPTPPPAGSQAESIAAALGRGRRVALESSVPIETLARQVWNALPVATRRRASVATWAFGNDNRFDLVALPRLAGVELDASYAAHDLARPGPSPEDSGREPAAVPLEPFDPHQRLRRATPALGAAALVLGAALGLIFRSDRAPAPPAAPATTTKATLATSSSTASTSPAPRRADYREDASADERRRATEGLLDLAERFGAIPAGDLATADPDPAALMTALAERVRYRGPWLSPTELAELREPRRGEPDARADRDRAQALDWHARVRRFAADRPLPDGFRDGPLRWQLDTLAWSFHLDDDRKPPFPQSLNPSEIPHALTEALSVDVSLLPSPLAARHPALTAYRDFLSRLPRR